MKYFITNYLKLSYTTKIGHLFKSTLDVRHLKNSKIFAEYENFLDSKTASFFIMLIAYIKYTILNQFTIIMNNMVLGI